jgi:hypothetical protein
MVHSILIVLDSRSSNDQNNNDFTVYFNSYSLYGQQFFISLDSAIIPNLSYPVRSGYNSVVFRENGAGPSLVATLTAGYYNATDFCSQLKTQLEVAGANTYTISINTNTKKITIDAGADTIELRTSEMSNGMCDILGFGHNELVPYASIISGSLPVRLDNPANDYVLVQMDGISNNNMVSQIVSKSILDTIPMSSPYGDIVYYENNENSNHSLVDITTIDSMRVRLLDASGGSLQLPSNGYIMLKLRLTSILEE